MTSPSEHAWIDQWRAAGVALDEQRASELRALTPERALAATEALLGLANPRTLPEARRTGSGLVDQQALFHRKPR
jgi:hypothetical protein